MQNYLKPIARFVALLMALLLLVCAAACKKNDKDDKKTDKEDASAGDTQANTPEPTPAPTPEPKPEDMLIGEWTCELDYSEFADGMFEWLLDEENSIDFHDIKIKMVLTFEDDGTYNLKMDRDSMSDAMDKLFEQMLPILQQEMREWIANELDKPAEEVTDEECFDYFRENGYDINSWDELRSVYREEMGVDDEMFDEMVLNGEFEVEEGKLRMGEFTEDFADEDGWVPYTVTETTLTIYAGTDDLEEEFASLLPFVFTKTIATAM